MSLNKGIQIIKYNGSNKMSFEEFSTKVLTIRVMNKGFNEALLQDLNIVQEAADQDKNIRECTVAWYYMMLALSGVLAAIVKQVTSKNPYKGWVALLPSSIEALQHITQKMQTIDLKDNSN